MFLFFKDHLEFYPANKRVFWYVLGVAICPSPWPCYPIVRHDVMYVGVGVVTGWWVLIPAAHCFLASAESFNLSAAEERDEDRLGSTFN